MGNQPWSTAATIGSGKQGPEDSRVLTDGHKQLPEHAAGRCLQKLLVSTMEAGAYRISWDEEKMIWLK